jgi:hypothetical protein
MKIAQLEQLSFEVFARLVKSKFRVWFDVDKALQLELQEATVPRITPAGGMDMSYESFSLLFLGPAGPLLPQGTYPFECEPLGRFDLFIVPIGRDPSGVKYEAAFNRPVKQPSATRGA